jgi:hypothetical protein
MAEDMNEIRMSEKVDREDSESIAPSETEPKLESEVFYFPSHRSLVSSGGLMTRQIYSRGICLSTKRQKTKLETYALPLCQ